MAQDEVTEQVRFSREAKIAILLLGAGLLVWLLMRLRGVLGPFIWGGIIAYIFSPVVDWLEAKTRLRRIWVVVVLYLVGLAVAAWAATAFVPLVIQQARGFLDDIPKILTSLGERLAALNERLLAEQIDLYGLRLDPTVLTNEAVRYAQNLVGYVTRQAIPAVFGVLEGLGHLIVCLIISFYLLRSWKKLSRHIA
ncbi:MAG: AI-2E family transporter, partial [Anaerolineae bacterium]|nr:AI-2E family transporter [Anaerolineae bacterium]